MCLNEIGLRHGTDKSTLKHGYTFIYERYFAPLRDQSINLLEIGVKDGASLRMWAEYFPNASIYGIDIDPKCVSHETDRIKIFAGDQQDAKFLDDLATQIGPFDIIVDDGSHRSAHQQASFRALFPYLKDGGWYVVEDLAGTYGRWGSGYKHPQSSPNFLKSRVDDLNYIWHRQTVSDYTLQIGAVLFYPQLCIIQKQLYKHPHLSNYDELIPFIYKYKFKTIVEVGVRKCQNATRILRSVCGEFIDEYWGVDIWQPGRHKNSIAQWEKVYEVAQYMERNIPQLQLKKMRSVEAAKTFEDGYFDLVYIDANHRYIPVQEDIAAWWPKLKQGGAMTGHDYTPGFGGVRRAVLERFPKQDVFFLSDNGSSWGVWK